MTCLFLVLFDHGGVFIASHVHCTEAGIIYNKINIIMRINHKLWDDGKGVDVKNEAHTPTG